MSAILYGLAVFSGMASAGGAAWVSAKADPRTPSEMYGTLLIAGFALIGGGGLIALARLAA